MAHNEQNKEEKKAKKKRPCTRIIFPYRAALRKEPYDSLIYKAYS